MTTYEVSYESSIIVEADTDEDAIANAVSYLEEDGIEEPIISNVRKVEKY